MKETEIRPQPLFHRFLQICVKDIPIFFDPSSFTGIDCPGCGENAPLHAFVKNGFTYVECPRCRSLYANPRPSAKALDRYYRESSSSRFWADEFYPATSEPRRKMIYRPRAERIREHYVGNDPGPQIAVDVGSGYGIFAEELRRAMPKVAVRGIEPGASLAEVCRHRGIPVLESSVEEADTWAGQADLVTSFEVIEHVHSPFQFTKALHRLLRPGGTVLLTGLGIDGFDTQILWEKSKSIQPPHHLNFLSVEGFQHLFRAAGFESVTVTTPGELDVDIVLNALADNPESSGLCRFHRLLLKRRGPEVHARFQEFLAWAGLSSHVWVWGQRA